MSEVKPPTRRPRKDGAPLPSDNSQSSEPITAQTTEPAGPPPLQAGNGMQLRGKRDAHPATPDLSTPKRSSEEVQADKKAKADAKEAKKKARQAAIAKAAEIEDRQRKEDQEAKETGHHPPQTTKEKKARKKASSKAKSAQDQTPEDVMNTLDRIDKVLNDVAKLTVSTAPENLAAVPATAKTASKRKRAEKRPTSSLTVSTPTEADIPSPGDETITFLAADDEEIQTAEGLNDSGDEGKPPKKARVKKGELRAEVKAKRSAPSESGSDDQNDTVTQAPSKKRKKVLEGFRKENTSNAPPVSSTDNLDSPTQVNQQPAVNTEEEGAKYEPGGFADDEGDEDERDATVKSRSRPVKIKAVAAVAEIKSTVKIVPTTSVPELVTPTKRRKDVRLGQLASDLQIAFSKTFMPVVLEYTGCLTAWDAPKPQDLAELWGSVMPKPFHEQFAKLNADKTIETLVEQKLTAWRNLLGRTALVALKEVFQVQGLTTADERKEYVRHQLEGDYRCRNFYYLNVLKTGDKTRYGGPFQSFLIAKTLAEHLKCFKSISEENRVKERPVGALVLTIIAVQRALTFYETGDEIMPRGGDGHFSQSVWGDRQVMIDGKQVELKTTTQFHEIFQKNPVTQKDRITSTQWDNIIKAAQACIVNKMASNTPKTIPPPAENPSTANNDWVMPDDDPEIFKTPAKATSQPDPKDGDGVRDVGALGHREDSESASSEDGEEDENSEDDSSSGGDENSDTSVDESAAEDDDATGQEEQNIVG
ncbi:hypothetical protein D9758_003949 [Tetrapyrgos nigripes]|uniref:Uncharacterized protein n=1 Tax=Tetrapyrgos nigripes TaxID=182062 RepID=A0A8H5GLK4_9AGAR|nr:hypothetical protein D9758_003949 [Tetrapyrgos nigripes]